MKRFVRTIGGKAVIFILCVVMLCTFAACVIAGIFAFAAGVYYSSAEGLEELVLSSYLRSDAFNTIARANINADNPDFDPLKYPVADTNLRLAVYDEDGKLFVLSDGCSASDDWDYSFTLYAYWETDELDELYTCYAKISEESTAVDIYSQLLPVIHLGYSLRYAIFPIAAVAAAIAVACLITLMSVSGRRADDDELHTTMLTKIPYDLVLAFTAALLLGILLMFDLLTNGEAVMWIPAAIIAVNLLLALSMSLALRVKLGTLFTNTVIWRILSLIGRIIRFFFRAVKYLITRLPLVWKTVLAVLGITFLEFFFLLGLYSVSGFAVFLVFEKLVLIPAALYIALSLRKLERAGQA
ncbi:MAG: hypothetical protein HUJ65_07220, partial [Oscillospiraceae bacterium]|nr:hypothetical protein [Oscillospiraceae bacterium]